MLRRPITEQTKLIKVKDPTADGTTAVNSASVDMQQDGGWEGVRFFTSFGTAAANNLANAAQSADDSTFDDLADSSVPSGSSDEDVYIDIFRPGDRYVRMEIARGTSTTVGDIWAELYGARKEPTTQNVSGTIDGVILIEPEEGTA